MLKEITRAQAIEAMTKEKPVFMLHEIDGTMTINDLITADGFMIEVEDEEPRKASSEPRNEVSEADSEVKRTSSETKRDLSETKRESSEETKKGRPKIDREKVIKLHAEGLPYKLIARELGCSEWSVCQIVKQEKKNNDN